MEFVTRRDAGITQTPIRTPRGGTVNARRPRQRAERSDEH
jgi:hypothetical protein